MTDAEADLRSAALDSTARAAALRALHNDLLVVPNAWDAGSAAAMARAGAPVIATTSAGISWSLGRPDGQMLTRREMVEAVGRIVAAVDAPVSADIEGGYGHAPEDVATTVAAIVATGAVGVNLEDSLAPGAPLLTVEHQALRLRAAREAAARSGLEGLWVNARTDVFLSAIGDEAGRLDEAIARAVSYRDAGADSLFVPGLLDLPTLKALAEHSPLPINAMAGPGGPSVDELRGVGVRRVTVGAAISQAAYSLAQKATLELFELGTYDALDDSESFATINRLFG